LRSDTTKARAFTRTEAHRHRDEARAELDAADVVHPEARAPRGDHRLGDRRLT
jgi:hypothetical protein